jgi:hypothetical protein
MTGIQIAFKSLSNENPDHVTGGVLKCHSHQCPDPLFKASLDIGFRKDPIAFQPLL